MSRCTERTRNGRAEENSALLFFLAEASSSHYKGHGGFGPVLALMVTCFTGTAEIVAAPSQAKQPGTREAFALRT